jgi:non-ribosomal peptide synthetase-like protein
MCADQISAGTSWLAGSARPDFLRDELLHEIFQASAERRPTRPALRCRGQSMTYGELLRRSQQTARYLRALGVGRGERVVVWMPRGLDMYAVMLGILQAGGTYVPLDPDYPLDRVAYVVRDSGARVLMTAQALAPEPGAVPCRVVLFANEAAEMAGQSARPLSRAETGTTPDDCAYIIYTSGSTGRPKGVMIPHRAICHFVRAEGSVLMLQTDDLVFQGSSLSFDMSLEEIWPAWAAGATLLVGTTEMQRAGGDLAPLLAAEGVTVWTGVPTLLALQEPVIPTLRLLNLGGEICPPELVRRWARPGRRILNTYGPTETSITATFAELTPGRPVTIGQPLPNYTARILNEQLEPTAVGEAGELCIGGPGLALGYAGLAELTAERFVPNPRHRPGGPDPRLYRTGDRARITAGGEIEFLGRIDTQVKIRGFRVELSEIESVLVTNGRVKQAVVTLQRAAAGDEMLVAYVVPREDAPYDESAVRAALRRRLPTYMMPAIFEPLAALPMLPSGKVDRRNLPPPTHAAAADRPLVPPETPPERRMFAAWSALFAPASVSIDDDFFLGLGGHSLRAAALVSALRKDPALRHVSMVDVYNHPTVRRLAAHLEATRPVSNQTKPPAGHAPVPRWRYLACAAGQAVGLILVYGLFSLQWLIPYLAYAWLYNQEELERPAAIAISLGLFILAIPLMLALGVAAKWLILGRLRPGAYPLWGLTYYRWWLTQRLLDTVPIHYLGGSPLLAVYLRLLGARIGRGVFLGSGAIDAPDCVEIGDDAGFGPDASLSCCTIEAGWLKVGTIRIGRGCQIGTSTTLAINTAMGDGAELDDLSMLPPGHTVPAGEKWGGSPARFCGPTEPGAPVRASDFSRRAFGVGYVGLLLVFPLFAVLPIFPGMILMTELDQNTDAYQFVLLSPLLAAGFVVSMCLQIAALKWLLIGRVRAKKIPVFSLPYVRHWLADQLMQLSLDVVNPIYATLFLNPWYRLLGVRLGPRAEISTASSISHDLLQVGEESFIADAVSLGAPHIHRGVLSLEATVIGRRTFIGNSAVIPSGTTLGDGVLVGVLSVPPRNPADARKTDSSWFGTPAVFLPQRQMAGQYDEGSTFRPKRRLILQRLIIECFRVILPLTIVIALTSLLMSVVVDLDDAGWEVYQIALAFPLLYLCYALLIGVFVVAVKWLVIGRYRPIEKPLWNQFVWRSELVTSTYENLAVPFFVDMLRGTPFLPAYLRLLGCRIGRRVFMDTTDITEFDVVRIGDDAALNNDCGPQTHLFEDRVMKISRVDIGDRCTIGAGSIVLYDTRMEADSALGELSMLMKGETLPAGTHWEGSPARPAT